MAPATTADFVAALTSTDGLLFQVFSVATDCPSTNQFVCNGSAVDSAVTVHVRAQRRRSACGSTPPKLTVGAFTLAAQLEAPTPAPANDTGSGSLPLTMTTFPDGGMFGAVPFDPTTATNDTNSDPGGRVRRLWARARPRLPGLVVLPVDVPRVTIHESADQSLPLSGRLHPCRQL